MKVKDILELVGDKFTVVNVNDKIYDYNFKSQIYKTNTLKRRKGLFCHYKTSETEVNEVLNKDVSHIYAESSGVITIVAKIQ